MKLTYLLPICLLVACAEELPTANSPEQIRQETAPLADPVVMGDKMHREFYPNGKVKVEGNMKDGKRHGLWTGYNEAGTVVSRGEFITGLQQGPAVVFHDNGAVFYSGSYKDDKQIGIWHFYDELGEKIKSVDFDDKENLEKQ